MKTLSSITRMAFWVMALFWLNTAWTNNPASIEWSADVAFVELSPYMSYYIPSPKDSLAFAKPESIKSFSFSDKLSKQWFSIYPTRSAWIKVVLQAEERTTDLVFVSRLCSYSSNIYLYYQDSSSNWKQKQFLAETPIAQREFQRGEASIGLPSFQGELVIYLFVESQIPLITDYVLFSAKGFAKHQALMSKQILIYLVFVGLALLFALLGGFIFQLRLPLIFALYVLTTSLYILMETNWLAEHLFASQPKYSMIFSLAVYGIYLLGFIAYTLAILPKQQGSEQIRRIFRWFILASTFITLAGSFLYPYLWMQLTSSLVTYGIIIVFLIAALRYFRYSPSLPWFITGLFVVILVSFLIDFHAQGLIHMPSSYYLVIPSLIIELLLVGIGTIVGGRTELAKMKALSSQNANLKKDIERLKKEVERSQGAYETLMYRSNSGALNVPDHYLDQPLSRREIQILYLLSKKFTNRQIADALHLSHNTIKTHLKNVYQKLEVNSRDQAVEIARQYGIL